MTELKNRQIKYFDHIKRQHSYEKYTGEKHERKVRVKQ